MVDYESPTVELIYFNNEKVITGSNCNCIYDKWNEEQPSQGVFTDCEGDSLDAEELFGSDAEIPI